MFSEILVAYDGSDSGHDMLDEAVELAAAFRAKVHLAAVAQLSDAELLAEAAYPGGLEPAEEARMQRSLVKAAAKFAERGCAVETHPIIGTNPAASLRDMAFGLGVDLIILGHRRQGPLSRLWNGSVGLALMANAPCSILVAMSPQTHVPAFSGDRGAGDRRMSAPHKDIKPD
jgi:nucleotide-binding universal stress UspA family protein